ncbi:hypothetical protein LO771_21625 [Streptacidiphilus sp. ASG 303]|uniref:hypothetical protein n=1 Tax=Streptacidiphilus sp. ASG 303 TaxID=2896847 RepID=UPI001E3E4431|nr:hypothetical protein [Streptacidiphilus sp. ASG 303]MCD0484912.1 hypothetical protein [Streptacidiphilus sp. ASG 303]
MERRRETPYGRGGDGGPGEDDPRETALYALVAERLRVAHARVRALNVSDETRVVLVRRLLAVTESAKRDLPAAARRLGRIVADLEAGRTPPPPGG